MYQVTRTGHDHCDATEGNLLDITPLKIDNRKVVTLYDKDLTDGTNLLIGKCETFPGKFADNCINYHETCCVGFEKKFCL